MTKRDKLSRKLLLLSLIYLLTSIGPSVVVHGQEYALPVVQLVWPDANVPHDFRGKIAFEKGGRIHVIDLMDRQHISYQNQTGPMQNPVWFPDGQHLIYGFAEIWSFDTMSMQHLVYTYDQEKPLLGRGGEPDLSPSGDFAVYEGQRA
ncbi:MAG: hypothetical protein AAF125_24035, partial [Chloroflexota bacterium]